jgi:hypothetical protein
MPDTAEVNVSDAVRNYRGGGVVALDDLYPETTRVLK